MLRYVRKEAFEVFPCFSRSEGKSEKISIFFEKSVKIEKKIEFFWSRSSQNVAKRLKMQKIGKID